MHGNIMRRREKAVTIPPLSEGDESLRAHQFSLLKAQANHDVIFECVFENAVFSFYEAFFEDFESGHAVIA